MLVLDLPIFEGSRITIAKQTFSQKLRAMGYRKLSAWSHHRAQAAGMVDDFKIIPRLLGEIARKKEVEIETIKILFQML